jgi:hypothetical protein
MKPVSVVLFGFSAIPVERAAPIASAFEEPLELFPTDLQSL